MEKKDDFSENLRYTISINSIIIVVGQKGVCYYET